MVLEHNIEYTIEISLSMFASYYIYCVFEYTLYPV